MALYDLKTRIKMARERADYQQEELAALIRKLPGAENFTQQTQSKLERGKQKAGRYIPYIAHVCKVSAIWLAAEIGPMQVDEFDDDTLEVARGYASIRNETDKQYIRGWIDAKKTPLHRPGIDQPEDRM